MRKITFLIIAILLTGCATEKDSEKYSGEQPDELLDIKSTEKAVIGYIGCSNTRETVEGYHRVGGSKMWSYDKRYDSGSVIEWARNTDNSKYWKVFDDLLKENPETKIVWWELCIPQSEKTTDYEHAQIILNKIRARIPEAIIYVSPLPPYTEGECRITGTWGIEKAKTLANELDEKNKDVLPGPELGPMTPKDTAKDGCHLSSPDGKRKLGNQMKEFFDDKIEIASENENYEGEEDIKTSEYEKNKTENKNNKLSSGNNVQETKFQTPVGYIGCSNTMQTVGAHSLLGGTGLWEFEEKKIHQYDSGAVMDWKNSNKRNNFWKVFDQNLEKYPDTKIVWWELCIRKEEPTPYEDAAVVLEDIRKRIPEAIIYVSPLPPYTEGECRITGTRGIERAQALANELDEKNDDVFLGPELGPMTPEDTDKDGCHLSENGMKKLGKQMISFFGGGIKEREYVDSEEVEDYEKETSKEAWQERIKAAMAETKCPEVSPSNYPDSYYKGELIDTHIHIASIPDSPPEENIDEDKIRPVMGVNVKISDYICMMDVEKTSKAFAFFPVWDPITQQSIEIVNRTIKDHPDRFVPFIMPPDHDDRADGFPTVDSEKLSEMLKIQPGLFKGYGEIGLYERGDHGGPKGAPALPPDSERMLKIYPVIRENKLLVYVHLGEGQKESFEKALEANPDIKFIWHGDQLVPTEGGIINLEYVDEILNKHPNAYYGVDQLYGNVWLIKPEVSKEEFITHFKDYDPLLKKDMKNWKAFIERHPDQVLWGTDRGWSSPWSVDPEVAVTLNDYSRAFIGKLDPEVQEKFAHKNAEKLIAET